MVPCDLSHRISLSDLCVHKRQLTFKEKIHLLTKKRFFINVYYTDSDVDLRGHKVGTWPQV